jgi:hypothetical protein
MLRKPQRERFQSGGQRSGYTEAHQRAPSQEEKEIVRRGKQRCTGRCGYKQRALDSTRTVSVQKNANGYLSRGEGQKVDRGEEA